jgi:hypothetical protein
MCRPRCGRDAGRNTPETNPADPAGAVGRTAVERGKRMTGRSCGECTLCCKLLSIPELHKPEAIWCAHCKPGLGCSIYQERPGSCRDFACKWLLDPGIGDIWYPRRSKMVLHQVLNEFGTPPVLMKVLVDRAYPTAWRQEPYYSEIKRMALFGLSNNTFHLKIIVPGTDKEILVLPDRDIESPGAGVVKRVGQTSWQFLPCESDQAAAGMVKAASPPRQ